MPRDKGEKDIKLFPTVPAPLVARFPWLSDSWNTNSLRKGTYACAVVRLGDAQIATVLCEDVEPSVVLLGPPFSSMDGEYHAPMISYDRLMISMNSMPKDIKRDCTRAYAQVIGDDEVELAAFAQTPEIASKVCSSVEDSVPQWVLMCVVVAVQLERSVFPPNMHKPSVDFYEDLATAANEKLDDKGKDLIRRMYIALTNELGSEDRRYSTLMGAKITPLTLGEVVNIGSVRYQLWRELFADYLAAKLVFNLLTDAFPMFGQWAIILGGDLEMYSAHVLHERFSKAPIITQVREKLKESQTLLLEMESAGRAAAEHIGRAITTVDSRLELTDLSLVKTSEHVGFTLAHIILKTEKISKPRSDILTDPDYFEPLVFSWMYAIHLLHSKVGLIHADLHANNIAINWTKLIASEAFEDYYIGEDFYRVPFSGIRAHIIDFSRGILCDLPTVQERYGVDAGSAFLAKQAGQLVGLARRAVPRFADVSRDTLIGAAMINFEGVAAVCAILDVVVLAQSLQYAGEAADSKALQTLGAKLEAIATTEFETNIRDAFENPRKMPVLRKRRDVASMIAQVFPQFSRKTLDGKFTQEWKDSTPLDVDPENARTWRREMFEYMEDPGASLKLAREQAASRADKAAMVILKQEAALRDSGTEEKFTASQGSWVV